MTIADWEDLATGMTVLLARLAGVPSLDMADGHAPVSEEDAEWNMPGDIDQAELSWRLISDVPVGQPDMRGGYVPGTYDWTSGPGPISIPGDTYVPDLAQPDLRLGGVVYQAGQQRRLTFEVQARSANGAHDPSAITFMRLIASKIVLPSSRDALRELGLALQGPPKQHNAGSIPEDGRTVKVWALEFVCNGTTNVTDDPVSTVETINRTFTVTA